MGGQIPRVGENRYARFTEERIDMPAVDIDLIEETEAERVERWRADELERAGFAPDTAVILAGRSDVDLHAAVALIERGCPPELAGEILL